MNKIILIGSGELGSRHLQSLAKLDLSAKIYVVDPSQKSLDIAKEREEQIKRNNKIDSIEYHLNYSSIEEDVFDLAIVATGSKYRHHVFSAITDKFKITNLILEKFLFQSLEEYEKTRITIEEQGINTWVNCARREYDFYKELKKQKFENIDYLYQGSEWGLACNSIHQIDLVSYLTGEELVEVNCNNLEEKIFDSKRPGYIEFYGTLEAKFSKGTRATISCAHNEELENKLVIKRTDEIWNIDELKGKVHLNNDEHSEFRVPYQSDLTNLVALEILTNGKCNLPSYMDSMKLHTKTLEAWINFVNSFSREKVNSLAIT